MSSEYKWVVLTVTTVGIYMATLDSSIIVVGLPQVVDALHTNLVVGVWFITIYRLMITVLLVGIGRIADLYGRVKLYNWGFAVFSIGSLLSGLSITAEMLLIFRLVQGVGAALLFVNSVAIVTDAFSGGDLGKGIGINQVAINAGTITGYTLSGILIQFFTWRSIFLVNVPIGIFGTYWSRKRLKEISQPVHGEKFDIPGAITFSSSVTLLLLGLTLGGLTDPLTILLLGLSALLMGTFVAVEKRARFPVLDLSLFKIRLFTAGNIANLLSGLAFAALAFVMTLYFQIVRGYDPFHAGIYLIPLDATLILIGPISGSLSDRWGARGLSTLGLVMAGAGVFYLSTFSLTTDYLQMALGLMLVGLGIGLFRSPNASSVMGSVPSNKRGISSGVRSTIINTSIVASIPLVLSLMTADIPYDKLVNIIGNTNTLSGGQIISSEIGPFLSGLQHSLLVLSALILASALFSLLRGSRREQVGQ
ncbi:MAG TPA: MFS transporter [Candidatus Dormibacteraeota bacterium]|nr:MFS transporter [Candidatus Dormibacteraeota bacterium]